GRGRAQTSSPTEYTLRQRKTMTIGSDPRSRAGEVLAAIHARPGIARAELTEQLGLSSGLASDLVASLVAGRWLSEGEPRPRAAGGRGRPTRTLWAHPEGPLVAAVAISHETWRIEVCELGGAVLDALGEPHDRDRETALRAVAAGLSVMFRRHGERWRGGRHRQRARPVHGLGRRRSADRRWPDRPRRPRDGWRIRSPALRLPSRPLPLRREGLLAHRAGRGRG